MKALTLCAPAKLNLSLDVLGKRPDGYHELRMVMISVNLQDELRLTLGEGSGVQVKTNLEYLPADGNNIAVKAARVFAEATGVSVEGLAIDIDKRIPVCAGTAGGSSDGAAVLKGLNQLFETGLSTRQLMELGERVGSDVPYCVLGGTALAEGRGEKLTPLTPLPECWLVLCKPSFPISTPELFRQADRVRLCRRPDTQALLAALENGDLRGVAMRMYNVFEDVLPWQRRREIDEIRNCLVQQGALGACMSGTGPTVFGLFDRREEAEAAYALLREQYPETFLAQTV